MEQTKFAVRNLHNFLSRRTMFKITPMNGGMFICNNDYRLVDQIAENDPSEILVELVRRVKPGVVHNLCTERKSWSVEYIVQLTDGLLAAMSIGISDPELRPVNILHRELVALKNRVDSGTHDDTVFIATQLNAPQELRDVIDIFALAWENHSGDFYYPVYDQQGDGTPSEQYKELDDDSSVWDEESCLGDANRELLDFLVEYTRVLKDEISDMIG